MANDIWRSTLSSHLQTIDSHYYNITDSESWPVAGLLVLLDSNGRPVRTELHLYEDLPSHIQEAAVRQSRLVLQERYHGPEPVPLRILHTAQIREAMDVRLNAVEPEDQTAREWPWPLLATAGALVLVVVLGWGGLTWFGAPSANDVSGSGAQSGASTEIGDETASQTDGPEATGSDASDAVAQADGESGASGEAVEQQQLPPSRNARADIGIGTRVQILPGFSLALRSEAGALAGEVVGFLANEQQAVVLGGPVLRQGETDTIVWWLVELDDGGEAWAAANTSDTTLLVPVD